MPRFLRSIFFFTLLNLGYFLVYEKFAYMGFRFEISVLRILLNTIIFLIFSLIVSKINQDKLQNYLTYSWYILVFCPTIIFLNYNGWNLDLFLAVSVSLLIFLLGGYQKQKYLYGRNFINIRNFFFDLLIILIGIVLYKQAPSINIQTILLNSVDVIDSRLNFRYDNDKLISSYVFEPIARIIIPYLLVQSIVKKQHLYSLFYICASLLYYLTTGSLKSMLLPAALSILFFKVNSYHLFSKNITKLFSLILILAICESYFIGSSFSFNFPIRRLLFTPLLLANTYFEYFSQFPPILFGINEIETYDMPIARFVGEFLNNKEDSRASVGILIEAWLQARLIGIILVSLLIQRLFYYLDSVKASKFFIPSILTFIYYLNTSFLGALFLSHGFWLLFVLPIMKRDVITYFKKS